MLCPAGVVAVTNLPPIHQAVPLYESAAVATATAAALTGGSSRMATAAAVAAEAGLFQPNGGGRALVASAVAGGAPGGSISELELLLMFTNRRLGLQVPMRPAGLRTLIASGRHVARLLIKMPFIWSMRLPVFCS